MSNYLLIFVAVVNVAFLAFLVLAIVRAYRWAVRLRKKAPRAVNRVGDDPAPPGAEDASEIMTDMIYELLNDDTKLAILVQSGFVSWSDARVVWHSISGDDMGEEPEWDVWNATNGDPFKDTAKLPIRDRAGKKSPIVCPESWEAAPAKKSSAAEQLLGTDGGDMFRGFFQPPAPVQASEVGKRCDSAESDPAA